MSKQTADNKPDPNGCGRVKLLDWIRKRRPDLLPVARLIMGTPSFIRLVKAEGALRLPSADGDDLDFSAADWDPLSLECPDYNDPNYAKSACGVIQGRALSTILSVCFLHEICHSVQRDNPTMRLIGFADDICLPERRALARRRRLLRTKGPPRGTEEGSERLRRCQQVAHLLARGRPLVHAGLAPGLARAPRQGGQTHGASGLLQGRRHLLWRP